MISEARPLSTQKGFLVNNSMLKSKRTPTQWLSIHKLLKTISFSLFPSCCVLCGAESNRLIDLCQHCENDLPHNNRCCVRCSIPLINGSQSDTLCGECIAHPPAFDQCIAPLRYEFPISTLINRFKHQGRFCNSRVLADLLLDRLLLPRLSASQPPQPKTTELGVEEQNSSEQNLSEISKNPDLIVPVPLHWKRRFVRGFNQSQWLANYLGQQLNISVDNKLLTRTRNTPPQQQLKRKQRQKNLKGAFQVNHTLNGQHIALIDDVVTTGSTASELARLLKKAGASRVDIWCLARTPLEK